MKKAWKAMAAGAVLAWAGAAPGGMGVLWTAGGWVVEKGGDPETGAGVAANGAVTWQLLYAGADGVANEPDLDAAASGWAGGDDVVLATRVVPAGGGSAEVDGTSWDKWLVSQGGGCATHEDASWPADKTGKVFQRIYQGTPAAGSAYGDSAPTAFDAGYAGGGMPPDECYFAAGHGGVALDKAFPKETPGEVVDGVRWLYEVNGEGTVRVTKAEPTAGAMTMPGTLGGYTVTEVGTGAFRECMNITGMAIAAGVTNIMLDAFEGCTGLTDMTIPDAVTDIGWYAFAGCIGLTNVTVGAGVTNIEDSAFSECWFLATVSLPEGLVSIGAWAFAHNALADLRIPDSVADIGEKAFYISTSLTNVWLGTGIESVGENAFAYCDALAAVWVPVEQEGTGLLDAAGLPAGCEIHYYGTQTVTFDPNGGTCATATNAYAIGEAYGALPEAGRDGHDFAGWWDDAAGVEVTTNSIVTEKAARTLVAHWKEGAVTYWDPVAGTNGVCTNYTAYTGQTTLGSGWYVVTGAITNDGRIGIDRWERNAEVNLILRDGAELVAKGGIEVAGAPEHHLVVWAQSDGPGAGKLTATAGDGSAGIGGTCDSNSAADGFKHVYGGRVTINGGAVTATGGSSGGAGIGGGQDQGCEWVTVNGGTVEAIGGGTGGRAIGNGGSRSTYPAVMALHAGAKVLAGDDAAGAAPVAAPNRVAACLEEMYAKIGPCGPHEYEGGACKWCWAEDPLKQIVAEVTGWEGTYDGAGHGVTVRVEEPASGARVRYRAGAPGAGEQTEDWSESPVLFTNACNNAAVSVEISAEGYRTVTNHAAVTIRPAALAVTAKDQEYVYNGRPQGEGDTIYDDPVQIAAKVEAAGLKGEDRIGSVELDGQATDIDIYEDLVQVVWARVCNGTNDVTGNYEIGYARGTLTIAPPWQTVTFDPGGGTCGTETNQYRWLGRYGWLPEAARTLYTFDGWWATNEAGWARVGTDDRVTKSFERTLVARWLEGVATNGVRWLCATNGEGTVEVTGAVPAEGDLEMPEELDGYTVTAVGGGAFHGCADLRSMAIPDSVTEIGSKAFRECTALTNVTLGAGVTNIGDYAFEGCTSLASVAFPEGLAGIEQGAFLGSALTDAKLPDTTERIGDDVFAGCKALTNVWLGTGIESVGLFAFHLSTNLAAVWVPVEKAGTDLLEEARVPAGCEIHYYGTQTVTFDPNGGACGTATKDYEIGAPYGELPEARREGHSFQGWWATNAAGAVEVTTNSVVTEEASRTLEARWRLDLVALTVEAGRWGRAEAVFGGTTNVVAGGTATNFAVSWGAAVTVRAVPDGGFAVDGEGTAEFASLTNAASVAFAFLPEPTATLRWKYARNANGWFCAQIAIPWHAGYGEALGNLRFLFADRTDAAGKRSAYLVDTSTVFDPLGTTEQLNGIVYRAAKIETDGFAGKDGGERVVYGVGDETLASSLASVPKAERKLALRVVNRNIQTVEPLDNKIGYLAWDTGGVPRYLAIAPTGLAAPASAKPLPAAALNGAAAYGLPAAAVARGTVTCRLTAITSGGGGVEGTFEVAAEDAGGVTAESGALAEGVRLKVFGAESLEGGFAELDGSACGVKLTRRKPPYGFKVAKPGKARFYRIELEAEATYE